MSVSYERKTSRETIISNMVEIDFVEGPEEGFRKVKETLQRMGVPKRREKTLVQTAHVLHKQGRYYICHFKELLALDGRACDLSDEDLQRRNLIVRYLREWGLITTVGSNGHEPMGEPRLLKVLRYSDKENWNTEVKYDIGVNVNK